MAGPGRRKKGPTTKKMTSYINMECVSCGKTGKYVNGVGRPPGWIKLGLSLEVLDKPKVAYFCMDCLPTNDRDLMIEYIGKCVNSYPKTSEPAQK